MINKVIIGEDMKYLKRRRLKYSLFIIDLYLFTDLIKMSSPGVVLEQKKIQELFVIKSF